MGTQIFDPISLAVTRIIASRFYPDGSTIGRASMTGFFWRNKNKIFVVTNWHNVSGVNPLTGEYLGGFSPNKFEISFYNSSPSAEHGKKIIHRSSVEKSLFDENDSPVWKEHPNGSKIDVVLIELEIMMQEGSEIYCLNDVDFVNTYQPSIGDECFIVGYPEGFSGRYVSPIWKRGSVATLPLLDHESQPLFLLDTIGNQGLSGSPVIARGSGLHNPEPSQEFTDETIIGTFENFVGIYAGRIAENGIGSQLGRVWKSSVIQEILAHSS